MRTLVVMSVLTALAIGAIEAAGRFADGAQQPDVGVGAVRPVVLTTTPSAPQVAWPAEGQAAYALDGSTHVSPDERPVPIASLAKLMTAWVVVHDLPSSAVIRVSSADVEDTRRRAARGESVVPVADGEVLTRTEALEALLLPSANNVAAMLAVRTAGSESAFVDRMDTAADQLGMSSTTYTDPSGYDGDTVSTAADQLRLARLALADPTIAAISGLQAADLPVAGTVRNTDDLLGRDGFVAGKTGSTAAAGGCFAFRVDRGGRVLVGVVLGQQGGTLIEAGLTAADDLADQAYAG